jgi:hypothetical protein
VVALRSTVKLLVVLSEVVGYFVVDRVVAASDDSNKVASKGSVGSAVSVGPIVSVKVLSVVSGFHMLSLGSQSVSVSVLVLVPGVLLEFRVTFHFPA